MSWPRTAMLWMWSWVTASPTLPPTRRPPSTRAAAVGMAISATSRERTRQFRGDHRRRRSCGAAPPLSSRGSSCGASASLLAARVDTDPRNLSFTASCEWTLPSCGTAGGRWYGGADGTAGPIGHDGARVARRGAAAAGPPHEGKRRRAPKPEMAHLEGTDYQFGPGRHLPRLRRHPRTRRGYRFGQPYTPIPDMTTSLATQAIPVRPILPITFRTHPQIPVN